MNNILLNYILKNFLKKFFIVTMVFYSFGMILNLFEEVEFFKNLNVSFTTPFIMTSIFIPSMIINILPFVIFISSIWFIIKIKNNKDFLTLKVFGYSNLKMFFVLAITAFLLGWFILFFINPITSSLSKYYEKTKSKYSKDIDHLITFNSTGLWIKENFENKQRIISGSGIEGKYLIDVTILHFDENSNLTQKLIAKEADIEKNIWLLKQVQIYSPENGVFKNSNIKELNIKSNYNLHKINNLYKNFDTLSFVDLIFNFEELIDNGYSKKFLNKSFHTMLILPFFLMVMTGIASIFTMSSLKNSNNFRIISFGLISTAATFYFKDLSIALGQTDRIPLILSVWAPIIILSLIMIVGVLQINEK